jgi:hypothetical protein
MSAQLKDLFIFLQIKHEREPSQKTQIIINVFDIFSNFNYTELFIARGKS